MIELKRDHSSDDTVGQILRYVGWVEEQLVAELTLDRAMLADVLWAKS